MAAGSRDRDECEVGRTCTNSYTGSRQFTHLPAKINGGRDTPRQYFWLLISSDLPPGTSTWNKNMVPRGNSKAPTNPSIIAIKLSFNYPIIKVKIKKCKGFPPTLYKLTHSGSKKGSTWRRLHVEETPRGSKFHVAPRKLSFPGGTLFLPLPHTPHQGNPPPQPQQASGESAAD